MTGCNKNLFELGQCAVSHTSTNPLDVFANNPRTTTAKTPAATLSVPISAPLNPSTSSAPASAKAAPTPSPWTAAPTTSTPSVPARTTLAALVPPVLPTPTSKVYHTGKKHMNLEKITAFSFTLRSVLFMIDTESTYNETCLKDFFAIYCCLYTMPCWGT